VCNASVQFLLSHDPEGLFSYAPLQGETAKGIFERHPEIPADLDSMILVEQQPDGERLSWYSGSLLRTASYLSGPLWILSWLVWVPRPVRDWFYRRFAASRYTLFGEADSCVVPSLETMTRILP
jgi:predicted DCC family thiol-disulfide oxidoreductase YuxK